jgi:hypothetical protein
MRDEDIISAARGLRPQLRGILGADAARVEAELDSLLARAGRGEPVADDILALLAADQRVRQELRRRLPEEADSWRGDASPGYAGLPGRGDPSRELVYRCDVCGYEYPLFEVGEPVPEGCPNGHGPLVLVR